MLFWTPIFRAIALSYLQEIRVSVNVGEDKWWQQCLSWGISNEEDLVRSGLLISATPLQPILINLGQFRVFQTHTHILKAHLTCFDPFICIKSHRDSSSVEQNPMKHDKLQLLYIICIVKSG